MIPPKVYALADDATLLVKMEQATLSRVKVLLELFEGLSGLGCNVDKTMLMQVGSNDIIDDDILGLGFDQKNEITILGMKLKNKGKCYESNMDLLIEKLRHQVRFWSRFNLSLPGRINVAKTFMYSQITYLGCILPINKNACTGISQIIEDFVNGPLRISKKRIFQKRAEGGLESIEIHDFLNSQNCVWVKRAADLSDNWKLRLYRGSYGNIFNLRANAFDRNTEPLLHNIARNFENFSSLHIKIKENYKKGYIFDNPIFPFDEGRQAHLTNNFFANDLLQQNKRKIWNLQVLDFLPEDGLPLSYEAFCRAKEMVIPEQKFRILSRTCINASDRFKKEDVKDKSIEGIDEACKWRKKLSRYVRILFQGELSNETSKNLKKYADITETICSLDDSRLLNSTWGFNFFDNSTKTFLFKLHNSTLGYNYTVTKFVNTVEKDCTFCSLTNFAYETTETPLHIFFNVGMWNP
jgi:hypothetical protein